MWGAVLSELISYQVCELKPAELIDWPAAAVVF